MVQTGQWLLPHRGAELCAEKPTVFMWLQAATEAFVPHWSVTFLMTRSCMPMRMRLLFQQTGTRYAHPWHHVKPF